MLVKNPSHRKALNSNQIYLLKILFKFRFVTVPLLSEYLHKDRSTIYEQLLTLSSQDFIYKKYDSTYRLPPKPAIYHLAPKGIRFLRDSADFDTATLRNQYKNTSASSQLIDHNLQVFKICNHIRRQYPDTFDDHTASTLADIEGVIRPLPDLYLQRKQKLPGKPSGYFIELLPEGIYTWLLRKRIWAHIDQAEEAKWQYPNVLLICSNNSTERRAQLILENAWEYLDFLTVTRDRVLTNEHEIWQQTERDDTDAPIYRCL